MIDMIGQKFERLTVVELAQRDKSYKGDTSRRWKCICICGKEVIVSRRSLLHGRSKSCGCLRLDLNRAQARALRLPGRSASENRLYRRYQFSAKSRNLELKLSLKEILSIVSQSCHYCGQEPNQVTKTIRSMESECILIHNGIDRKDSSKGYTIKNTLPCCKACNKMKMDLSYDDFLDHIKKINEFAVRDL